MTLSWAVIPKPSSIWPMHPGMLVDLSLLVYQYALDTFDTVACVATLLDKLILTSLLHGHSYEKECLKLYQCKFDGAFNKLAGAKKKLSSLDSRSVCLQYWGTFWGQSITKLPWQR